MRKMEGVAMKGLRSTKVTKRFGEEEWRGITPPSSSHPNNASTGLLLDLGIPGQGVRSLGSPESTAVVPGGMSASCLFRVCCRLCWNGSRRAVRIAEADEIRDLYMHVGKFEI